MKFAITESAILIKYTVLFLFLLGFYSGFSQVEKANLEANKKKIEQEIRYTNDLLNQTRKTKKISLNELIILDDQIKKREALILTINHEIIYMDHQISMNNDSIRKLINDLKKLKDEYAEMIYYAFKNKNFYNRLMFIFAADDFNQAYRRSKYFQQYSSYRKVQAELIQITQQELERKTEEIENQKIEKEALLNDQKTALSQLAASRAGKSRTVQSLTKKEIELKNQLKSKEKAATLLQKAIEDIIAEEIRLSEEKARTEASMKIKHEMSLTPMELKLSENFENNKGKLPWPSEKGVISGTFGEHPHPVLKKVKINNNGIDILTSEGSNAKAIFDGVVTRIMNVPNYNNVVIIRHGEYLTVYSNLNEVFVKKGEKVKTWQDIGYIFTDKEDSKTELHFEIWKAKTLQNPLHWLSAR